NRAKRPERNINGFGNVPWSDADGAEARKNEKRNQIMHDIFSPGPSAQNVVTPAALDPRAQIPKRKIIAYDDL
ncbi:16514_t:CDS:2, partial [Acaulospora morrowiae]